jgi:hypothetical protein
MSRLKQTDGFGYRLSNKSKKTSGKEKLIRWLDFLGSLEWIFIYIDRKKPNCSNVVLLPL